MTGSSIGILILAAGVLLVCGWVYARFSPAAVRRNLMPVAGVGHPAGFDPRERAALEQMEGLARKMEQLKNKIDLVEEHCGEYFDVLPDRGWTKVVTVQEQLDLAYADMQRLISEGSFEAAQTFAIALSTPEEPFPTDLRKWTKADLSALEQWEMETNNIITCVAMELASAAENTKQIGISRSHKRKPTLAAIDELKRLLAGKRQPKPQWKEW